MSLEDRASKIDNRAPKIETRGVVSETQRRLINDLSGSDRSVTAAVALMLDKFPPSATTTELIRTLNFAASTARPGPVTKPKYA